MGTPLFLICRDQDVCVRSKATVPSLVQTTLASPVPVHDSAVQKDKMLPFAATWMDPEIMVQSEISQTENTETHTTSAVRGS